MTLACLAIEGVASNRKPSFMAKMIKNGSVELYVETFGNAEDVPVLLIAGAMAPAVFWEIQFCESLAARGYYVIRFDNRDIRKSIHFQQRGPGSGIELPYTIYDMVTDAKMVLENLKDKSSHIIGRVGRTAICSNISGKNNFSNIHFQPYTGKGKFGKSLSNKFMGT